MKKINFLRLNNEEKHLRRLARDNGCSIKSDAKEFYVGKAIETENAIFHSIESAVVDFVNHRIFDNESIETIFLYSPEAKTQEEIDDFYLDLIFDFVDSCDNFKMYIDNGDKVFVLDAGDLDYEDEE